MIYAFCNPKGGTGKTTTVLHAARMLLDQHGIRSMLIDLDASTQSLTRTTGCVVNQRATIGEVLGGANQPTASLRQAAHILDEPPGVELIPATLNLANVALGLKQRRVGVLSALRRAIERDAPQIPVLIDCPGDLDVLTLNALMAADAIIIPVDPEENAIFGVSTIQNICQDLADEFGRMPYILGTVACKVDERLIRHGHGMQILQRDDMPPVLATIPKRAGVNAVMELDDAYAPLAAIMQEAIVAC